jgi:hypothetical protein
MNRLMSWWHRRRRRVKTYRCYWLCLHFASAEAVTRGFNEIDLGKVGSTGIRLITGGERVPVCTEET